MDNLQIFQIFQELQIFVFSIYFYQNKILIKTFVSSSTFMDSASSKTIHSLPLRFRYQFGGKTKLISQNCFRDSNLSEKLSSETPKVSTTFVDNSTEIPQKSTPTTNNDVKNPPIPININPIILFYFGVKFIKKRKKGQLRPNCECTMENGIK